MHSVGANDFFEIINVSCRYGSDEAMMIDCYLPLLGGAAFALREALLACKEGEMIPHERLLGKLRMTPGEFYNAMEALEALGLVRTFCKSDESQTYFIYCLYSPLSPEEFFADPLFAGTLAKYVGEKEYNRLKKKYASPSLPIGFEEATSSFIGVYLPDFADPIYLSSRFAGKSHGAARVKTNFDLKAFEARLSELGTPISLFSEAEIRKIEGIAALYRLSGETIADFVNESFDMRSRKGARLDVRTLSKKASSSLSFPYLRQEQGEASQVSGDTPLAEKIRMMDSISPAQFLSYLQNGHRASSSDLRLVESLSLEMGLPDPVINALIDYVLQKNDNILSAAYCEKIAAALQRKGLRTARDTMEYLTSSRAKKKPPVKPVKPLPHAEGEEQKPLEEDHVSEEEFDNMIASLYND